MAIQGVAANASETQWKMFKISKILEFKADPCVTTDPEEIVKQGCEILGNYV